MSSHPVVCLGRHNHQMESENISSLIFGIDQCLVVRHIFLFDASLLGGAVLCLPHIAHQAGVLYVCLTRCAAILRDTVRSFVSASWKKVSRCSQEQSHDSIPG